MGRFQQQRAHKPKAASKKPKEPETFDEIIDAGVSFEEQGERYAKGDRAQRYYERAAAMYEKANQLNKQDADCLYNWGHVLLVLVNLLPAHTEPEEKLEQIDQSIDKFRQALQLEKGKTDAQFNLGQALHLRSEVLQETTDIDDAYNQSAIALQEATTVFENVYTMQEAELKEQKTAREEQSTLQARDPTESLQENGAAIKQGDVQEEHGTVTQAENTTVYSLIETLVSMAETMTTMASMLASVNASKDLFHKAQEKLSLAKQWLIDESPDDKEHKEARIQINLKEAQTLAAMADRYFIASDQVDHALFRSATAKLDEVVDQLDSRSVEAMCDRGDIFASYAQALADAAEKSDTALVPDTTGKEVWQLYTRATKSFQDALKIEPKNLSILNKLGDVSIARSQLDLPVAERNSAQLFKNAEFYFKQAVKTDESLLAGGWIKWAFSVWVQETRLGTSGKEQESAKIIKTWMKRGGTEEMLVSMAEDNDALDEEFVEWARSLGNLHASSHSVTT